jgi:hypothetical protein
MLRVYCDSNVFRILKSTHPFHKKELHETFEVLREKLLFCYSDAHLDDLKESKSEYRDIDLEFMGGYVKDNYFSYDPIKSKQFECYLATPTAAFAGKDYDEAKRALENPFDFDHLTKYLDDTPELKALSNVMNAYFDLPIAAFGSTFDNSKIDEKGKKWMEKIMPGYYPMMSLREFMNSVTPFGVGLLQDEQKVAELRKYIGEYMNRENFSFEKWGLEFNQKFKETGVGKSYLEMVDSLLTDKQKDDFYIRFSYLYTQLEMYNITQERKSGGGLKKFTLDSLNTDALHAYYGSFCDYLVTDDKGLQVKANIVYQLLGFETKVLSTNDFINLKTQLAGQEETYETLTTSLRHDIKHSLQLHSKTNIETGSKVDTYKTFHAYFNYFNRMQIITDGQETTIALYCDRKGHGNFFLYRETELLVKKLTGVLGTDNENKGLYDFAENDKDNIVRQWTKGDFLFSLTYSYRTGWGNFICLCIDFTNK